MANKKQSVLNEEASGMTLMEILSQGKGAAGVYTAFSY